MYLLIRVGISLAIGVIRLVSFMVLNLKTNPTKKLEISDETHHCQTTWLTIVLVYHEREKVFIVDDASLFSSHFTFENVKRVHGAQLHILCY